MQDSLMAQTAQTRVPVHNLDFFSKNDISKYWKEGEDSRESCFSIDDKERYVIDFETVCEISNTSPPFICMRNDHDFMATINELC